MGLLREKRSTSNDPSFTPVNEELTIDRTDHTHGTGQKLGKTGSHVYACAFNFILLLLENAFCLKASHHGSHPISPSLSPSYPDLSLLFLTRALSECERKLPLTWYRGRLFDNLLSYTYIYMDLSWNVIDVPPIKIHFQLDLNKSITLNPEIYFDQTLKIKIA